MRYVQLGTGSTYPYPNHNINPAEKDAAWCMAYARAAYYDWSNSYPKGVFSNNGGDYEKYRMYALGKQPNTPYKKWLGVEDQTNNTWLSVDWSIRSIVSPYRDRAISRLMEQVSNIIATPCDMLAKSELTNYYNNLKAKLAVRKLISQVNQDMASHPMISIEGGEPMDIEELEMRIEQGEQFNRSKDAELAIAVGFQENDYKQFRRSLYEDLFDYGVCGYKEWLGSDNKAKFRKVFPECVVTSYCRQSNFSDMVHAGEVTDVSLVDLALVTDKEGNKMFTDQQLQEFASSIAGRWGNPALIGTRSGWLRPYDKFKCKVMDICFYSYDDYTYTDRKTKDGNPVFRMEEYNRGEKNNPRYMRKCFRVVYQCKWIIGTEYCYDWGLMDDQKLPQDIKKKGQATLPYKFYAYNYHEMHAQGFMERLVPYLDDFQLTMLKIQNFKNRAVPSGWWIDLDALENVALNKGGANMQPKELLQMFFETGVLVGRSKDITGIPQSANWKPVIPIENTAASELAMFYADLINTVQKIESITGYNDITTGDPNPKTLIPGYETANISTNHALYPMKFAEEYITVKLAEDVLLRMQQGIKKGGASGYAYSLNTNTLKFIEISPSISLREYGITLQERTSEQEKMWLMQQVQQDIATGMLDTSDAILIINTHNAKQAMQILAYKVKKNKELMQQYELQKMNQQAAGNAQVAQATQQMQMQQRQMEMQFELQKQRDALSADLAAKKMQIESNERIALSKNQTTLVEQQMESQTKETVAAMTGDAKVISTHVAGEKGKEKQEIANQKPKSESKK